MEDDQTIDPQPYNQYSNFVKASIETASKNPVNNVNPPKVCGLEAKRMYLEEVPEVTTTIPLQQEQGDLRTDISNRTFKTSQINISTQELLAAVQNNDSNKVRMALLSCPDKVNTVDEFGWSLLMIACQANSVETVKVLLKQGADLSFRDKAGNSARSLVINSKNATLASLIIGYKDYKQRKDKEKICIERIKEISEYTCDVCSGQKFPDKMSHIASTLHNINVSKDRKIPSSYKIPESNKGFQIMLKSGWDKDIGLGASGSGMKYPIKCVPKKDRKGLGNEKSKSNAKESKTANVLSKERHTLNDRQRDRIIEVNFRREFY